MGNTKPDVEFTSLYVMTTTSKAVDDLKDLITLETGIKPSGYQAVDYVVKKAVKSLRRKHNIKD